MSNIEADSIKQQIKTAESIEEILEIVDKVLDVKNEKIHKLEEENKSKQKAYDDCYCEYKHHKQFDSIPKQKVKDKIEEIKEDKESKYFDTFLMTRDINYAIDILKELLKDK